MTDQRQLTICLDYDNTYTADPELWNQFIELVRTRNHRVVCATMRYEFEMEDVYASLGERVDKILHTSRHAKKDYLEDQGIYPDIWIDDTPEWLLQDCFG